MTQTKKVFGFGSLINSASLLQTAPTAHNCTPAYIQGFRRQFGTWINVGMTGVSAELTGIPYCALDIVPKENSQEKLNGILFSANKNDWFQLMQREQNYQTTEIVAYDFMTNQPLGAAAVFFSQNSSGGFDFGSLAQLAYLQICLDGASQYGQDFVSAFMGSTYINDQPLAAYPDLLVGQPSRAILAIA